MRLRDIAASLDVTERSAFGVISDLVEAGYVVKEKDGRRNRYHIQAHLPLPEPTSQERTVGEVLALLTGTGVTVTGKSASAPDSPAPGSGQDGRQAAAEQVHSDLLDEPTRPSAMAGRRACSSCVGTSGKPGWRSPAQRAFPVVRHEELAL